MFGYRTSLFVCPIGFVSGAFCPLLSVVNGEDSEQSAIVLARQCGGKRPQQQSGFCLKDRPLLIRGEVNIAPRAGNKPPGV